MNEPRQPKETLSWVGRSDRPGRRAVDRLISGGVRTTLTTVAVPMARAGALSLELLERRLGGDRQTLRAIRLPTQLVVRESTGPVAIQDVSASQQLA